MKHSSFHIYYREVTLEEGFRILAEDKENRLVRGKKVSSPRGLPLFQREYTTGNKLMCWCCGIEASCFVATKHKNDIQEKSPVLDLYAYSGTHLVLMTRDHIIPRSLGGSNDIRNLRIGCVTCNRDRGNTMSRDEQEFMKDNPHLITEGKHD
jgi:hypothetical protein